MSFPETASMLPQLQEKLESVSFLDQIKIEPGETPLPSPNVVRPTIIPTAQFLAPTQQFVLQPTPAQLGIRRKIFKKLFSLNHILYKISKNFF